MPHCLVLVCHHLPPQTTSHNPTKPPWLHHANTHTMLSKVLDGGVCGVAWLHACASTHLVPWSITTTTVCGCHSLSPCHVTPSMSSTPNHVNRCAMCGCGASCPHTSQTCLLHALHGVGVCGGVVVHTGLDATPVVHTMGCNALVCCHQCLCVALCALPSIVSTTTTTTLLHHWCVCGWSTPGQCCWAVCWLVSLITLLHHTPFLLFVLQLVCCAVCGSACVATGVVCVGGCCCTLPQSPSQALVNVAPGCPCVVMLHHMCVCQVVLFGHTWLTTMWWALLMLVSLAVHMWWLFVTT